jgi:hypothetical protein
MAGFFSLFRCRTTTRSVLFRTVTWWPGARRTGRTGTLRSKTTAGRRVRTRLRGKQQQRASCTHFASIYQDRLGTNIGKALKTRQPIFSQGAMHRLRLVVEGFKGQGVCENGLSSHLCISTIILPRQARDKHRESTQKQATVFL